MIGADGVRSVIRHALYGARQSHLYRPDGLARAPERQRCAARGARADRPYPMGRARLSFHRLLHPRRQAREHRHARGHRQMGRGRLVDPRRPRRDALELSKSRAAAREAAAASSPNVRNGASSRGRSRRIGAAAVSSSSATRPMRCCRMPGRAPARLSRTRYILARWLEAWRDPVEAFRNFRRVRIPRVHAVQRLSIANARFKHMRDSAAQKALITSGKGSVHGNSRMGLGLRSDRRLGQGADGPGHLRRHQRRRAVTLSKMTTGIQYEQEAL